jgi:hypothetical protein
MDRQANWVAEGASSSTRRAYPRYRVDTESELTPVSGAALFTGRLLDLGLGGCRMAMDQRVMLGILTRVEVRFQLRGIAFRVMGVTAGTRTGKSFAVRFLEMPRRRLEELAEVLAEVALSPREVEMGNGFETSAGPMEWARPKESNGDEPAAPPCPVTSSQRNGNRNSAERRVHGRHTVNTQANLHLVGSRVSMAGRILNLSEGGCRLRTDTPFDVGVFVRLETEFYLHGLPFRIAGVSQAILDRNTIGIRFLDMSQRRREQLTELMAEIAEAEKGRS